MAKGAWLTPGERRRVVPLTIAHFLILASMYLLKPARNALVLDRLGIRQLPYVLIAVALIGGIVAWLFARYTRDVRLDRLVLVVFSSLAVMLLGFWVALPLGYAVTYYAFYVWVQLYGLFTTSLIWLYANTIFDAREARRVFNVIGSGGIAGAIAGGFFTGRFATAIGTESLLLVSLGALVVSLVALSFQPPTVHVEAPSPRRGQTERKTPFEAPLLRYLALTTGLTAIIAVFVDIQFNGLVDAAFHSKDEKTSFFGTFFAGLSALSFVVQLVVTPLVLRFFGVGAAYTVLPVSMGAGAAIGWLVPGLGPGLLGKGADVSLRHSIHKAASEVLFLPLPADQKRAAKLFLDTAIDTFFSGLGALGALLLTGPLGLGEGALKAGAAILAAVTILLVPSLLRAYVGAFREALAGRDLDLSELRTNLGESQVVGLLFQDLESKNDRQLLYLLSLLGSVDDRQLVHRIEPLLAHASDEVRAATLEVLIERRTPIAARARSLLLDSSSRVKSAALYALVSSPDADPIEELAPFLNSDDPRRLEEGLMALGRAGPSIADRVTTQELIDRCMNSPDEGLRAAIAATLPGTSRPELWAKLEALLGDPSPKVVQAALLSVGRQRDLRATKAAIELLGIAQHRAAARAALIALGPEAAPQLLEALADEARPLPLRRAIPRALETLPTTNVVRSLLNQLEAADPRLRRAVRRTLSRMRIAHPKLRLDPSRVLLAIRVEGRYYAELVQARLALEAVASTAPVEQLLRRALREKQARVRESIFTLLGLRHRATDMANALLGLAATELRASALEFLENVLDRELRAEILPLFDPGTDVEVAAHGNKTWSIEVGDRLAALRVLLIGKDRWLRACALAVLSPAEVAALKTEIEVCRTDVDPIVQESAARLQDRAA